jgi:2-oxoglutarate dehydrogenase complex dehydrogenase (E1) component-like enzyme
MINLEKLSGPNAGYLVGFYEIYLKDPASVDPETRGSLRPVHRTCLPWPWKRRRTVRRALT